MAEESDPDQAPALLGRIFTKRTLLSIVAALVIVALAVWRAPINWGGAWAQIRHANLLFYALALLVYYLSFVARGARWQVLLANAGEVRRTRRLAPVVLASFFVNCVVPAKLGDVYRAYLGGVRERIPGSKAFGTVVSERLLDLCVLMALLLVSGGYVFHKRSSAALVPYVIFGSLLCMVGIGVILAMRAGRGTRLLRLLPEGIFHRYESFRFGAVTSLRRWPTLLGLTFSVWICESGRLGLVIAALGYSGQVGISQFVLVALVAALLTTIPFTPGGLGLVQAGVVGALVVVTDVGVTRATAIALLDGSISYASLLVFGFIAFAAVNVRSRVTETASARGERREHDAGVTPPGAAAAERLG
ncbi:MAG TPA: lysylphosphatidylglycerol synthase transmembrane domain-containing protein [Candidatus Binatia bacterium]|nr:lysylphosphatidylglycerol synthase transmembrane domain-containing protein [Candidatus Binatia bacterium]